jgi:DNA mismatch repair protein MutH
MELPYNPESRDSIVKFAKCLIGKSLREACDEDVIKHGFSGKGNFGQVLEKFYFLYEVNSISEPDFPLAKLELKSTPLKQLKNKEYRSKERLVLNIINYLEVVNQEFESSSFWKKNAHLLLVIYLHDAEGNILDYEISLVDTWDFPSIDLEIIKRDWEFIKQKIIDGKAHELSEGDTFYLGACTKGASAKSTRQQPFSEISAKQRAFSLKQGYVNHIIASIASESTEVYGKLIETVEAAKGQSIEEIVISKFNPYINLPVSEIIKKLKIDINQEPKSFYANLTKSILGIELDKEIEEFEKAEITVKTIRVEENDRIKESISFKTFKWLELVEENWHDSTWKSIIEKKFLFVFYKQVGESRVLQKVKFWNMPYADIQESRKVWLHTKHIVTQGRIVKEIRENSKGTLLRKTYFMGSKDNPVSHVRPHGKNGQDTFPLPKSDKLTKSSEYTKHCFWLNNTYVKDNIYLK